LGRHCQQTEDRQTACTAEPASEQGHRPPQGLHAGRFSLLVAASLIAPAVLGVQDWLHLAIDATAIAIASMVLSGWS
jgi:hypothetical protein